MSLVNAQWNGEGFVLSEDELVRLLESDMELAALGRGGLITGIGTMIRVAIIWTRWVLMISRMLPAMLSLS